MVGTMALLPLFNRPPRAPKGAAPLAVAGLPADDEMLLDAPDEMLAPALVAAGRGEHRPAAELLAATRARHDWESRDRYVVSLAAFADARPEWFEAWRAEALHAPGTYRAPDGSRTPAGLRTPDAVSGPHTPTALRHPGTPHDPDLLLVAAQLAVRRAWRSPARAELLREVSPLITAAAGSWELDPVPWRIALDHARGAGCGHKYFGELWEAAVRRAPHHSGCHVAALRYLASSWHGSHVECFDFADRAAQDAPAQSPLQALPVLAAFSYLTDGCGPEIPRARLDAAADRAVVLSARLPSADARPAEIRNLLVYVLTRLGRREDALVQLRLLGPYVTSFPWDRLSDDPLAHFLAVRDDVRHGRPARAAGGHGGHTTAQGH